jgi:hypothetical protein
MWLCVSWLALVPVPVSDVDWFIDECEGVNGCVRMGLESLFATPLSGRIRCQDRRFGIRLDGGTLCDCVGGGWRYTR